LKTVLAVVVLYRQTMAESPSCRVLLECMAADGPLRDSVELLVTDNSPEAQPLPADFPGRYVHDGENPGLAKRYNLGLRMAAEQGLGWLLLLDQDTSLTREYLDEMLQRSVELANEEQVAAVAPKLVSGGVLQSPHRPPFQPVRSGVDVASKGILPGRLCVYNSGALLRVSALLAIEGFPEAYGLDYLDHAVFAQLQARGGRVYVMDAQLEHEMSIYRSDHETNPAWPARQRNQLASAVRFYREFGSLRERWYHRLDLLRQVVGTGRRGHFSTAGRLLEAALLPWGIRPVKR
jgi:GT2 family glycosyltransferase